VVALKIDNDVKEKYKTSPPQTCGEKGIPINRDFLLKGFLKWQDFQEQKSNRLKTTLKFEG